MTRQVISFVIPVFRNVRSISIVHEKITSIFQNSLEIYDYEFVFVNDGSDDGSFEELQQIALSDKKVKIISFSRNFGQVPAIAAGMKDVTGDAAVIMSADLQDPPELIVEMIVNWESGNEIIVCNRLEREDDTISVITSKIFYSLTKKFIPNMPPGGFDFILLGRKAILEYNKIDERNRFLQGDILWLGFAVKFIPYTRLKREHGKSQWSLSKKIKYFIDGVLNSSYSLIRFMSLFGSIISLLGFCYALVVVYERLINNLPFPGYAPIVILILTIGGLTMLMLGIIGEYIWRIYDETRKRPYYIIEKKINF